MTFYHNRQESRTSHGKSNNNNGKQQMADNEGVLVNSKVKKKSCNFSAVRVHNSHWSLEAHRATTVKKKKNILLNLSILLNGKTIVIARNSRKMVPVYSTAYIHIFH